MIDTSGTAWGKNSQDAIEGQHIPVSRITLADLRDSDIDWRTYALGSKQAPTTRERKVPRDHQVRARSAVMAGFDTSDRGQLVMACGTGKTFTSLIIAREFIEREGGSARILFAVPSLALLKQTLDDWRDFDLIICDEAHRTTGATLTGIPAQAQRYSISGRSPLEWIIDRYHVKTDKASGIVNDPNDFLRERGRPDAVVDLIKRLVTVSMRTQELLATLPKLEIPEGK